MSYKKYMLIGLFGAGVILTAGCGYDKTATEPTSVRRCIDWPSNASFKAQADNAVLTSMTVADIHFLPYRSELNSLGRARLAAIASYLELYGGQVIVDSRQSDELTRQERLASVRQFLLGQGLDAERLAITSGLTRGRGQDASEAALFYEKNLLGDDSASSAAAPAMSAGGGVK